MYDPSIEAEFEHLQATADWAPLAVSISSRAVQAQTRFTVRERDESEGSRYHESHLDPHKSSTGIHVSQLQFAQDPRASKLCRESLLKSVEKSQPWLPNPSESDLICL